MIHPFVQNVLDVVAQATPAEREAGANWYTEAHAIAKQIGKGNVQVGAGVIAALSPQTLWRQNVVLARECRAKGQLRGTTYARLKVAQAILNGAAPLSVIKGLKTRAFYVAIVTKGRALDTVCIDRHAISICLGREASEGERTLDSRTKTGRALYEAYKTAYLEAAQHSHLYNAIQLQAITWVVWRRLNPQSRYRRQMGE